MSNLYSTVDQLSSRARSSFGDAGQGNSILTGIIWLSAVLSALFFWSFSKSVFVEVYPPAALALGLIVGLMPAEGAFFGWKRIRASKADLTSSQLKATKGGLYTAVFFSVFSTLALFVATVPFVPGDIAAYADWLVFLSLAVPVPVQVCIIAYYSVNERATVENHENAKLAAMGFDAWIKAEQARVQAVIDGINLALDAQLKAYGDQVGSQQADHILTEGRHQLLNMGAASTPPTAVPYEDEPATAYDDLQALVDDLVSERLTAERAAGHTAVTPSANGHAENFTNRPGGRTL